LREINTFYSELVEFKTRSDKKRKEIANKIKTN
jgi:hypothetical protein